MRKYLLVLAMILGAAVSARGQGAGYTLNPAVPNGTLYVCNISAPPFPSYPCPNLAAIYTTSGLSTPISQPVSLGSAGTQTFYAAPGVYGIQISVSGVVVEQFMLPLAPVGLPKGGFLVQQAGSPLGGATTFNCSTNVTCTVNGVVLTVTASGGGGGGFTAGGDLSGSSISQQVIGINGTLLSGLSTGFAKITTATGAISTVGNTGSGNVVLATSPTLVTPNLGTPSAVNLTNALSLPCAAEPALTGDATTTAGACAVTVVALNGTNLAGLATGIVKITTGTGVPSIAVSGTDYDVCPQNTTANTYLIGSATAGNCSAGSLSEQSSVVTTTESASFGTSVSTTSDAVHNSLLSLSGNTTNKALGSNTVNIAGPATTTGTSYAWQLPFTNPAANEVIAIGAPNGNGYAAISYVSNATTVNGQTCTLGSTCTITAGGTKVMLTGTSNYTNATTGQTAITGLTFTPAASTNYKWVCSLFYESSGAAVDMVIGTTGISSPTNYVLSLMALTSTGSATTGSAKPNLTDSSTSTITTGGTQPTANFETARFELDLQNNAGTGAIQLTAAASASGTITIATGSSCVLN